MNNKEQKKEEHTCKEDLNGNCYFCERNMLVDPQLSWTAKSLLAVCREHKEKCQGNDSCDVSMYLLGRLYEKEVGRGLNAEESALFI